MRISRGKSTGPRDGRKGFPPGRRAWRPLPAAGWLLLAAAGLAATAGAVPLPATDDVAARERPVLSAWTAAIDAPPRGYDVSRYDLDLRIDPGSETIDGRVLVALDLLADHPDSLWLDLVDELTVDTLAWDGAPLPFVHGDERLAFVPPDTAPGRHTVLVAYHGHPPRHGPFQAGMLFRDQGGSPDRPGPPVVFTISEPVSAHAWWPCRDEPADKALVSVTLTVPDTLQTVSGGRLTASAPAGPGWRRDRWEMSDPVSTYLVAVHVSRYAEWEEPCPLATGELPLTFHVFPADSAAARFVLAPTCEMLGFLERLAGPYPFARDRYGQAAVVWGGAMEHQTCTSLGSFVLYPDGRFRNVVVHELAHQWFGDAVTPARWSDIWLNEGFATYAEALWLEHTDGEAAYLGKMQAIGPLRHPDLFAGEGILTDPDPILPNLLVYHKGAWVLHMLRWEMGDAAFFRFLAGWVTDPARRHGTVTTDDFLVAVADAAGRDLRPFLQPWLTTDTAPRLSWSWRAIPAAGGGSRLELTVRQLQQPPFLLPLPVVADGPGWRRAFRAELAAAEQRFAWPVPGPVDSVRIDPDGRLLLALERTPPPAVALGPPYPQPLLDDAGTVLRFTVGRSGPVTVTLHDVRGRELGRWRLGELEARPEPYLWTWTGTDGRGRAVPAGIYWLSVHVGDRRSSRRVTLLR